MDLELVKQLYEENADKRIADIVNLHLMGEPTLHPELIEILKFGASKNIKTDLVTNISTLVGINIPKSWKVGKFNITSSSVGLEDGYADDWDVPYKENKQYYETVKTGIV